MYWASLGIFRVHIKQLRQTYHSASACRISSKSDHPRQSCDVISFSKWRPRHRNSTSPFGFRDFAHPRRSKFTCIPNFGEISQSTAEILLLSVSKSNVRHVGILLPVPIFTLASPSACHSASAYVQIGPSATELWRHIHFSRWRPGHVTSGFGFRDFAYLARSKSPCIPNFGEISQSTAKI